MNDTQMKLPLAMFLEREQSSPDKIFLRQPINGQWITYTWKQAGDEIRRIVAAIQDRNLPPKSTIGLVSKNCAHWVMADLAIMMSGHISVPLYPNIGSKTINYVLKHSEAKILFVGKLDDWEAMKPGVPSEVHCISFPFYGHEEYEKWEELTKKYEPVESHPEILPDDTMTIVYTSGTTGNPKGVVQKYFALGYALNQALKVIELDSNTRFFSYLPMSHIAERMLIEMGVLYTGGEIYFAESLDTFAKNLTEAKPTVFLAVPRIWTKFKMGILAKLPQKKLSLLLSIPIVSGLIKKKIKKGLGLEETNHFFTGAAPISRDLLEWYDKLDIKVQEVYGMTENCAYSHLTRKENIKYGYVGQPMPDVDVKISDIGEILVKSKATMVGYYKEPELTAESFDDGYLKTGDQGEIDSEGFLKITGRVKDIFKTEKGKYIAPNPIEMRFSKNDFVEQICVAGSGLPQPIALVVLSEEARTQDPEVVKVSLHQTLEIINPKLESHERLHKAIVVKESWTVENNLLTPTLKIKRSPIEGKYSGKFQQWYSYEETIVWED